MRGILDVDSRLLSNPVRAWSWRNDVENFVAEDLLLATIECQRWQV
jgi:hypothetical protein